jgi:hypothetical protein
MRYYYRLALSVACEQQTTTSCEVLACGTCKRKGEKQLKVPLAHCKLAASVNAGRLAGFEKGH